MRSADSGVAEQATGSQPAMSPRAAPGWLEPELATLTRDRFSDPAWLYERKLDGERCLAYRAGGQVLLMTRNQHDVSATYPELRDALTEQSSADFVCDGEVVAFDGTATSFGRLQQRLGVREPDEALRRRVPVFYYVFDLLYADGRDVRSLPLRERKKLLRQVLAFDDPIRYTEYRDRDGEEYFEQACRQGWEGLIAKRADARYVAGRTRDWLKFKCENSQEFLICGYTDPQGVADSFRRPAARLLRPGGEGRLCGQGRDWLQRGDAGEPGPLAERDRAEGPAIRPWPATALRQRHAAAVGRALGRAQAGRTGGLHGVDQRRAAQASALSRPAPRQGPRERGAGDAGVG